MMIREHEEILEWYKALCLRAADALAEYHANYKAELQAELRKAAE